ncbi:hypothetical protein BJ165DRAFT_1595354 [Panaeolus papilionaceus]|nr:hypothetical protein BJ165DRAFT_1595354 [Panaeolus papilionaceus]
MANDEPLHVDLDDTIGIFEVGSAVAIFLFGIVTLQTYCYFTTFWNDRWNQKVLVGALWLLELGHTIGVFIEVYKASITLYTQFENLVTFPALAAVFALGGTITLCVQTFLALRVCRVIPKPYAYIGIICIFISSLRFVGSIALTVGAATTTSIDVFRAQWKWLIISLLSTGVAVDVTIAVAMLWYLCSQRMRAMARTAHIIDKMIGYTLRSGLLTSLSAIALLVTFLSKPTTLAWIAMYTFLAKLYSNGMLSVLNSREELRYECANPESQERYRTTSGRPDACNNPLSSNIQPIAIEMKTIETIHHDKEEKRDFRLKDRHSNTKNREQNCPGIDVLQNAKRRCT